MESKLTKSTGIYKFKSLNHFKFRIRIKLESSNDAEISQELFWQQKRFSKEQRDFYGDERNCFTRRHKEYHEIINNEETEDDDILFTYTEDDNFRPDDSNLQGNCLQNAMFNLKLTDSKVDDYEFFESLHRAVDNPLGNFTNWETMYVMADFGEYFDDLWVKNEHIICELKYNSILETLKIYPDFTNCDPYVLKLPDKPINYFIENCSDDNFYRANEESFLIKKIPFELEFKLPARNILSVFLFVEIQTGCLFEYQEIYVQYQISLPEGWTVLDRNCLRGQTQICKSTNNGGLLHFGHMIECGLEYNFMNLETTECPKPPHIYFEVLSKDSWDRYRTEGLCYLTVPISHSGTFNFNLNCFRFRHHSQIGDMKRFFIGDCQNYSDVKWISFPDQPNGEVKFLNKFGTHTIKTGELNVKLSTIHQSQEFCEDRPENDRRITFETLGSSTLIKSVEQVIQEFKKARREMLLARKDVI